MSEESGMSLEELTARLNASAAKMEAEYAATAITGLQFTVSYAARYALGCLARPYERKQSEWRVNDEDREAVALVFDSMAAAIRDPSLIAEDISPIRWDEF
jgi:hypothetical protein